MDWKHSGWSADVPDVGRYEVNYLHHTAEYEAWFWPADPRESGESVRAPDASDFKSFVDATDACEAHAKARGKLRAV